ncbi:transporter associated domain-containing protein [Paracoccus laeviglucosivorans]|uniref:CBS domain-containing protein n=1 Tax=Paracoccus laeviglucosivorans TaxID=1197861 RepID=A0A521BQD7_9RHOB|nr:CBS domain-containing protein [Paracoccus laeviglucosivorans]
MTGRFAGPLDRLLARLGLRAPPPIATVEQRLADVLATETPADPSHKDQRDRFLGMLDLGERAVEEVMLHRSAIEMIDSSLPARNVLDRVLASHHTRLPVFSGERENVVGVIHAKDLLRAVSRAVRDNGADALADFDLLSVAMPPYFVPDTTPLDEQLREFLKRRTHFALVVDEYGSLRGLVTLEDILEEIVGEIVDEHDAEAMQTLTPNAAGDYLIDGAMTIRDLNRALDWKLPDDEANTIAGLVIHMAQSIPAPGQAFSIGGFRIEVVARRENRLTRLRIRPLQP